MKFELNAALPIWRQLTSQLKEQIVSGEFPPGSHFPTVRDLAAEADVNPNTMQRAMTQLEAEGLLVTNRTAGRTVTEDTEIINRTREELAAERTGNYLRDMQSLGYKNSEIMRLIKECK